LKDTKVCEYLSDNNVGYQMEGDAQVIHCYTSPGNCVTCLKIV